MSVAEIAEEDYQDFIEKSTIAVIDFWGPKCSHCKELSPHIQHLAEEYAGKCVFGMYNVDGKLKHVASTFEVKGVPSILVYKNGTLIDRTLGYDNYMIP